MFHFNFPITISIVIGLPVISVGLFVYFLKNPDVLEKWLALVNKWARGISKAAEYRFVKYSVQSTINGFVKNIRKDVPNLNVENVRLTWIDDNITPEQFISNNQMVLRMHKSSSDKRNVVNATVAFVSYALLRKAKKYIADYQKNTIDLFATTKILENGHSEFLADFVEMYLADAMDNKKVNDLYAKFEDIHKVKMFFPVFINELNFLGEKVFSKARNNQLVYDEVTSLANFLYLYSHRKQSEDVQSDYTGSYCRFAIRIVGKKGKITNVGKSVYVKNITATDAKVETLYLLGDLSNKSFIDEVVRDSISQIPYYVFNEKSYKCTIKDANGVDMDVNTYLVVLRNKNIQTFHK